VVAVSFRVQLEEDAKARAAEQERLLAHEKELAAITAVEKAKIRSRRLVIGGVAFLLIGTAAAYLFGVKPALEQKALEAEHARQARELALAEKERAAQDLADAEERANAAEADKTRYAEELEARDQRQKEREARVKERQKTKRPKKKGETCAPDDPLCGLKLD